MPAQAMKLARMLNQHQPADREALGSDRVVANRLGLEEQLTVSLTATFDGSAVDENLGDSID